MTALPSETTTAMPVKAICVPSVHRIGVMLRRLISTPLMVPPMQPTTTATTMKASE